MRPSPALLLRVTNAGVSSHLSQATSLSDLHDIVITPDVIRDSIAHLKRGKSDGVGLSSDHIINASIV